LLPYLVGRGNVVIWRNVIKGFIRALTPIVIIPACLISLIFWAFGLTISSLLLIVTIVQIYLIWSQVEVALWQSKLSEISYEPVFIAYIEETRLFTDRKGVSTSFHVKVKNIANYPAYNIIAYLGPTTRAALPNFELSESMIGVLEKDREETLCVLSEEDVKKLQNLREQFVINVDYTNVLGENGSVLFIFHPQDLHSPFTMYGRRRIPGLLFNSIEELTLLIRLITWSKRRNKLAKMLNTLK
jgi:hypothetical protein